MLVKAKSSSLAAKNGIDALQVFLEDAVEAGEMKQTVHHGLTEKGQNQCDHFYGDGVYCRGLMIPAGTVVVGLIHKQARVCIIASGECTFVDPYQRRRVSAPWVGEFNAHCKTAVFAHTDCYWVAALGTDLGDRQSIMEDLTFETYGDLNKYLEENARCLA